MSEQPEQFDAEPMDDAMEIVCVFAPKPTYRCRDGMKCGGCASLPQPAEEQMR